MSPEKRILVVGCELADFETIRRAMRVDDFESRHVPDNTQGLATAVEFAPGCIVLSDLDLCQKLRRCSETLETPILWLAGTEKQEETERALRAGADEMLRSPADEMEARVRVRSVTRARQLRERIRDIQGLRQDFMDQLVHDIRSPLQVILGFSELLAESADLPTNEQSQIRSIRGAASRLESLADNLIVSTRLETGDLIPQCQKIDPWRLAEQVVETMRPVAALKRIVLHVERPAFADSMNADSGLITRSLQIYLDNAIRFSPSGSNVFVRVRSDKAAGTVAFEVTDRGSEVSEEEREQIFDLAQLVALRRAGHARHGRGLGLSLCRLVAEAHGGRARVAPNPGGGSVFILELPYSSPAPEAVK